MSTQQPNEVAASVAFPTGKDASARPPRDGNVDFRLLFETIPGLYLVLSPTFEIVAVSDAYLRATMTQRNEILGRGIFDVFPDNPKDEAATGVNNLRSSLERVVREHVSDAMAVQKYDVRRPDSATGEFEERYWSPANTPVFDSVGELAYIIHRAEDVTEFVRLKQRETEQEQLTEKLLNRGEQMEAEILVRAQQIQDVNKRLRDAHEALQSRYQVSSADLATANEKMQQLAAIVESSDDAIFARRFDGIITSWNSAAEGLLGYAADDIIGKSGSPLIPAERVEELMSVEAKIRNGDSVPPFETVRRRKDGTDIPVSACISPIRDHDGTIIGSSAIVRDISEKKNLERQLHQSQKMEVVGQLAGGIAHDFNNLLTVISGCTEMLLGGRHADDPEWTLIHEIHKAGERAAGLTRQLLAFSRKQIIEPKVLDLNGLVSDTSNMLRRMIGEDVTLATSLAPKLGLVKVDPGQIQQVLMNLAVNARDAMEYGGRLTIETSNAELDAAFTHKRPEVKPGRYVLLAVSDTGCGMTEEVKTHIFEPFFTTKGTGKGTGLGLATVYGIVKQSGGHIFLYSEPGHGTAFKIYFPLVEGRIAANPSQGGLRTMPTGTETILLVEDEDAVRQFSRFTLQMQGYTVLEAKDGEDAMQVAKGHVGKIDLLLTDVVMPRMGGRDLAERLTSVLPEIKVLFVSGYTDDAVVRHGILQAEVAFLQKPFTPTALVGKVREVLDQEKSAGPNPKSAPGSVSGS